MVSRLTFKGEKKPKKRKRAAGATGDDDADNNNNGADSKKQLKASAGAADALPGDDDAENDDSWVSADAVSDISGPVMVVLSTAPPAALACDANGKVFALPIENIVDGNPSSAEPHDVRQVWIANKVAGTEYFRFKGHHGKLLSCDKYGIFSATAEAVSPLESFTVTPAADAPAGTFQIQTTRETFLTAKTASSKGVPEVRGDAAEAGLDTALRVRMQARFKPRIKASKAERAREKISRSELEDAVGRRLDEDEVRRLKRARREGNYHEMLLDVKVKSKHDKYS